MILGTLEARVGGADLVILGGLNEGVWPAMPAPDPWLNRRMRAEAGLLLPERQIGLSAHDFQQAVAAREVVLTRSLRDAEAETVPSRWLNRLVNLLGGLGRGRRPGRAGRDARARTRLARRGRGARAAGDGAAGAAPLAPAAGRGAAPPALHHADRRRWCATPTRSTPARSSASRRSTRCRSEADASTRGQVLHKIMERWRQGRPGPRHRGGDGAAGGDRGRDRSRSWCPGRSRGGSGSAGCGGSRRGSRPRRRGGAPAAARWRRGAAGRGTVPDLDLTLVGQPDRIDRLHAGGYALVDYKSGKVPTKKEIASFRPPAPARRGDGRGRRLSRGRRPARSPRSPTSRSAARAGCESYPLPYDDGEVAFGVEARAGRARRAHRPLRRRDDGLHLAPRRPVGDLARRLRPPRPVRRVGRQRRRGAGGRRMNDAADRQRQAADPARLDLALGQRRLGQDAGADRPGGAAAARRGRAAEHPVPDLHQGRGVRDAEPAVRAARRVGDAGRRRPARAAGGAGRPGAARPGRRSTGRGRCSRGRSRRRAGSGCRRSTPSAPRSCAASRWRPGLSPAFTEIDETAQGALFARILDEMADGPDEAAIDGLADQTGGGRWSRSPAPW